MLNPHHLAVFIAIVQAGSISRAAQQMGCGKSVLSRQLARLEADLGARLIQRSTRRLALTEIGEMVLQEARQIDRSLINIAELTDQHQQQVRGRLRVSCSMAGRTQIVPLVVEFGQLYPAVTVALQFEDHMADLIAEQIDVAIRVSHLPDSSLVARKLADTLRVVVAAPSYLARAGTPQTPDELASHACLVYTNSGRIYDEWTFPGESGPRKVKVPAAIQINDGGALVTAACCGAGVLLIPRQVVAGELARGEVVEILTRFPLPPGSPTYAVYPARDWLAPKTSAFIDFLQRRMGESSLESI